MASVDTILAEAVRRGASDIHLVPGMHPIFRINTVLAQADGFETVTPRDTEDMVRQCVNEDRYEKFITRRDIDFSTRVEQLGRFRVNAHFQHGLIAISLRAISSKVPSLAELNLPAIVESLIVMPRGLVLVTGPTGSGKSTTLASMIDEMNHRYRHHVITLEDPVEYEMRSDMCVIEQREVGIDVPNFASGLRHALRQDPDVILVGEMRDLETTSSALTAAETGHLVLSTLHTSNAAQTVERIIDIYPGSQQNQVRSMLSNTLQAVISMTLFRRIDVEGMIPACEVMICTSAVRNCIRENRIHEISNIISTGSRDGMLSMDDAVRHLYRTGRIGMEAASGPTELPTMQEEAALLA